MWDERGERPVLWPLTTLPDRHTYSVHSVQYCLSCFEQHAGTSSGRAARNGRQTASRKAKALRLAV